MISNSIFVFGRNMGEKIRPLSTNRNLENYFLKNIKLNWEKNFCPFFFGLSFCQDEKIGEMKIFPHDQETNSFQNFLENETFYQYFENKHKKNELLFNFQSFFFSTKNKANLFCIGTSKEFLKNHNKKKSPPKVFNFKRNLQIAPIIIFSSQIIHHFSRTEFM